jgi:hypothetical protein
MNLFIPLTILTLAVAFPLAADGAAPHVGVDVKISNKADFKDIKGSSSKTKTQSRILTTTLSNFNKDAVPDVQVKWWIFGHNMKDHGLIILKQGESKVVVPANGRIEVASPEVTVTGTREHKVSTRSGRGKRSRTSTKEVPASGQEYYGYAVEVVSGGTQIAAKYSNPSIEKELHPR